MSVESVQKDLPFIDVINEFLILWIVIFAQRSVIDHEAVLIEHNLVDSLLSVDQEGREYSRSSFQEQAWSCLYHPT